MKKEEESGGGWQQQRNAQPPPGGGVPRGPRHGQQKRSTCAGSCSHVSGCCFRCRATAGVLMLGCSSKVCDRVAPQVLVWGGASGVVPAAP